MGSKRAFDGAKEKGGDKPGIQGGDIIYLDSDRFEGTLVFALRCIRFRSE